jgi:glycosyltransferase involved in cell wall biosynthesis
MTEPIFFSIVMAVKNGEKYIAETLEAILSQTYRDFELIVVDDGSGDRTEEIIENYIKGDKRIRVVSNTSGASGPARARNFGVSLANGTWIAICDADDLWQPEKLQIQADFIRDWQGDEPIVALGTSGYTINDSSKVLGPFKAYPITLEEFREFRSNAEPFLGFLHSSMVFDKKLFLQIGGYQLSYEPAEDADLFTRLSELGVAMNIDRPLTSYRKHLGSLQFGNTIKQAYNTDRIKENSDRRRKGANELTYQEYVDFVKQKMTDAEFESFVRNQNGKYFYRVGAINLANGSYISGVFNLLRALLYDQALVTSSLNKIFKYKFSSALDSFKEFFGIRT